MTRNPLLAALAAASLLAGCGALDELKTVPNTVVGWVSGSGPKIPDAPEFKPEVQVRTVWKGEFGESGNYVFSPLLLEQQVCGASAKGRISCLDVATGKTLWSIDLKEPLSAGLGYDGRRLLVVNQDSELIALERDGKAAWRAPLNGEVLAAPRGAAGFIVVRTTDGRLLGLDAENGKRRWSYQRQLPPLTIRTAAGVVLEGPLVIAGWPGGKLTIVGLEKGAALWEGTVAIPKGSNELERIADVVADPVINGERLCAGAFQGRTVCFDRERGQLLWAREIPSSTTIGFDFKRAYLADDKGVIHGLDRGTGNSNWSQDAWKGRFPGGLLSYGDYVWFGDVEGHVGLLDRASGKPAGQVETDGSQILFAPLQTPKGVLVTTRKGSVLLLAIPESK